MMLSSNLTSGIAGFRQFKHPYGWFVAATAIADVGTLFIAYVLHMQTNILYLLFTLFGIQYFIRHGKIVMREVVAVIIGGIVIHFLLPANVLVHLGVIGAFGFVLFCVIFLESFKEMLSDQRINLFLFVLAFNQLNGVTKLFIIVSQISVFKEYLLISGLATLIGNAYLCYFRYDKPAIVFNFGE